MADEITDLLQVKIEKAKTALPVETANAIAAVDWKEAIIGMRAKKGYTFEQLGDLELETELLLCGLLGPENYPKELASRMKISSAEANELVSEMNNTVFRRIREELIKNVERKKIFASRRAVTDTEDILPLSDSEGNAGRSLNNAPHSNPLLIKKGEVEKAILKSAGIEILDKKEPTVNMLPVIEDREDILKKIEKPELITKNEEEKPKPAQSDGSSRSGGEDVHPLIAQKFSGPVQAPMIQTEYSLNNISKTSDVSASLAKSGLPASIMEKIKPVSPREDKISKAYSIKGDPYRLPPED